MKALICLILVLLFIITLLLMSAVAALGFVLVYKFSTNNGKFQKRIDGSDEQANREKIEREKKAVREMKNFMKYDGSALDG